jgi:UDP-N-acetylmuramate dehydrogenase
VGGPAQYYIEPNNEEDLKLIFQNHGDLPITFLGAGSNVLIRDGGIDGIVIHLGKNFKHHTIKKNQISCQAGILLSEIAKIAAQNELSGFEFLTDIPGSLGGGLKMNAGAYGSDLASITKQITAIDEHGKTHKINPQKTDFFGYRSTNIPDTWMILSATLQGEPTPTEEIKKKMKQFHEQRMQTQPHGVKTAGSTFKNPPNISAWKLIDAAGLRGHIHNGAKMSEKHSNFMINFNNATATDLEELGEFIRTTVATKTGHMLEWEIKCIGRRK